MKHKINHFFRLLSWRLIAFPFFAIFLLWMHFWEWFHFKCSNHQVIVNRERYRNAQLIMNKWVGDK